MPEMEKTTSGKNKIRNRLREIWQKTKHWFDVTLLQKKIQRGAAWAVGISIVLASSVIGSDIRSGFGTWVDILVSALLAALGFFLFQLFLAWCFSIINRSLARPAAIFITPPPPISTPGCARQPGRRRDERPWSRPSWPPWGSRTLTERWSVSGKRRT